MWQLIMDKYVTLEELETTWSFDDYDRFLCALKLQMTIESTNKQSIIEAMKRDAKR